MMKNKLIFSHFLKSDGITKINKAKIDAFQLGSEEFDGIELQLTIVDGKIIVDILNKEYFDSDQIKWIKKEFKNIDWEDGYDFIDYYNIEDESKMRLVANKPSDMFDTLTSKQNISNLNNIYNVLKKH